MKDDAAPLCYRFFKEIPNNFFLYDIEIYPRIEKYIDQNDDDSYNYIVYVKGKYYFDVPNGKIEFKNIYK